MSGLMMQPGWQVKVTPAEIVSQVGAVPEWAVDWEDWLRTAGVAPGTPFLLSPSFEYDTRLNGFFRSGRLRSLAPRTQLGYARDLAAFLTFLWSARGATEWIHATEQDHLAYLYWRRHDPGGPCVAGATWNREVAAVNQFYRWALWAGHLQRHPIPQMTRRSGVRREGWANASSLDEQRPATFARNVGSGPVRWLPAASYRRWRDVGVRGFTAQGEPDPRFRGRWAARNAVFCDLMVRTGLRLGEQAALVTSELPLDSRGRGGYQRFWLPEAIAKGSSARTVYVPDSVAADLVAYVECDRADVIVQARAAGRYARIRRPLVLDERGTTATQSLASGSARRVKVAYLSAEQRERLFVEAAGGLEPAALWLGEHGMPLSPARWKAMFAEANARCLRAGINLAAHAHMLRHSFAVITLEQLQRGHLAALAELSELQRGHYVRVFGDPLDWVRRRLGHRSVVTTQIYLDTLAELEMLTRMALVPDDWPDPRLGAVDEPQRQVVL